MFVGRNLDWMHDACLVLRIHKAGKVASVSILDLAYLDLNRPNLTEKQLWQRIRLLFSPYYLQDGMNAYGVTISDMTLDNTQPSYSSDKPNIIHSTAMRMVLDDAKSTDEAIQILQKYNIHFGPLCHFLIADAKGQSAVVELLDGQMRITKRQGAWQVCTNSQIMGSNRTGM